MKIQCQFKYKSLDFFFVSVFFFLAVLFPWQWRNEVLSTGPQRNASLLIFKVYVIYTVVQISVVSTLITTVIYIKKHSMSKYFPRCQVLTSKTKCLWTLLFHLNLSFSLFCFFFFSSVISHIGNFSLVRIKLSNFPWGYCQTIQLLFWNSRVCMLQSVIKHFLSDSDFFHLKQQSSEASE